MLNEPLLAYLKAILVLIYYSDSCKLRNIRLMVSYVDISISQLKSEAWSEWLFKKQMLFFLTFTEV